MDRPQNYRFHQGDRVLPFASAEYDHRLSKLRAEMAGAGVQACVFTSMHNVAYYSGFLYCAFGRPYALVVTPTDSVTLSAGIDAAQPWRRIIFLRMQRFMRLSLLAQMTLIVPFIRALW
jgi:creatinase